MLRTSVLCCALAGVVALAVGCDSFTKTRDDTVATMQAEYRQRFGRFGFTTFAGAAQIAPTPGDLSTDNLLYAAGVGMRFQLLKRFPLNYRTDVAFGKDGATFYFSVGEAF